MEGLDKLDRCPLCPCTENIFCTESPSHSECRGSGMLSMECSLFVVSVDFKKKKKRTENHSFKMFAPGDQAACIGVGEMFVRMHIFT